MTEIFDIAKRAPDDHRSPLAIARDEYLGTGEGFKACDPTTLGAPAHRREYLKNRIEAAWLAGAAYSAPHPATPQIKEEPRLGFFSVAGIKNAWEFTLKSGAKVNMALSENGWAIVCDDGGGTIRRLGLSHEAVEQIAAIWKVTPFLAKPADGAKEETSC